MPAAAEDDHTKPVWTYRGDTGPAYWARLDKEFDECDDDEQSPIDLTGAAPADLLPLQFTYRPIRSRLRDTGHALQVDATGAGTLTIGGDRYDLAQFHIHTPSEHTLEGKTFPAEVHLVHRNAEGDLAVVGVLLETGTAHPLLTTLLQLTPGEDATLVVDPAALVPEDHAYFTYQGSLTVPPCTEGVRWFVLKTPVEISPIQHRQLTTQYPVNARYTHPLGGRTLQVSGG